MDARIAVLPDEPQTLVICQHAHERAAKMATENRGTSGAILRGLGLYGEGYGHSAGVVRGHIQGVGVIEEGIGVMFGGLGSYGGGWVLWSSETVGRHIFLGGGGVQIKYITTGTKHRIFRFVIHA